jgi:hypothetical protein
MHPKTPFVLLATLWLAALAACGDSSTSTAGSASAGRDRRSAAPSSGKTSVPAPPSASATAVATATASAAPPAPPTADGACQALAAAACGKYASCDQGYRLKWIYADAETCKSSLTTSCLDLLQAPDTVAGPTEVTACADAVAKAECLDVGSLRLPRIPACLFKGKRAADAGCAVDSQCQSGVCERESDTKACGKCLKTFAAGDACALDRPSDCQPELACNAGKCGARVAAGGLCTHGRQCSGGTCEKGKCTPYPMEGAACDVDNDSDTQLFCHFAYACTAKKCVPRPLAAVGEKCNAGQGPFCMRGECDLKTHTCRALAQQGEKCDAARECAKPLACLGGTCGMAGKSDCR